MQENAKRKVFDVTEGPMTKKYITYAIPLILINALLQSFNTADSIIIGRCASSEALGGISAVTPIYAILISLFSGLSLGVSVTVSQAIGEKDYQKARAYAQTSVLVAFFGGLIMAAVAVPLTRPLLKFMGTPTENLEYAVRYMHIMSGAAPIVLLYSYGGAILRAQGDTRKPLIFLAISGCVNVALNYVLIAIFDMNTAGAAIATVISNTLSVILIFHALSKGSYMFNISLKEINFDFTKFKDIVRIGLPTGFLSILTNSSSAVSQVALNSFGASAVAGHGASSTIIAYTGMIMAGFAQAVTTFSAQNAGAKKYDRVESVTKSSSMIASGVMLCLSTFYIIFREPLISLFIKDNAEAVNIGCLNILISTPLHFISVIGMVHLNSIQGLGKTIHTTIVSLIFDCALHVVWVYTVFAYSPTLTTLFLMSPVLCIPSVIAKYVLYKKMMKSHINNL